MAGTEFDIIEQYFRPQAVQRDDVIAGIGDDAALLQTDPGKELVVCMDTLVAGVHFPESTPAAAIGHKALAVNFSDLAAMGAEPCWTTLSLTLPQADADWLAAFAEGFFALAARYDVALVGGDTTRGPLSVTVQAHGTVPAGAALRRRGARPGDRIYVTGTLGDAGLALRVSDPVPADLQQRLDYPQPRLAVGQALRGQAHAVIDISDGLLADLGHLLEPAGLGARIDVDAIPRSADFERVVGQAGFANPQWRHTLPLSAGDDYELCFTLPPSACDALEQSFAEGEVAVTAIGEVESTAGIRCFTAEGEPYEPSMTGYDHFGGAA